MTVGDRSRPCAFSPSKEDLKNHHPVHYGIEALARWLSAPDVSAPLERRCLKFRQLGKPAEAGKCLCPGQSVQSLPAMPPRLLRAKYGYFLFCSPPLPRNRPRLLLRVKMSRVNGYHGRAMVLLGELGIRLRW